MAPLPGPDSPKRRRVAAPKRGTKKRIRNTSGNRYRSDPPPTYPGAPINPATGRPYPRPGAGRTGYGPGAGPAAPGASGRPPTVATPGPAQQASLVAGPYDRFKDIPGALGEIARINADQNLHQTYVNEKVAPWLSAGLTGLAQFNTDAQNQYMGNVQGGEVAGAIAPLGGASSSPGGVVAGNNSYLTGAGQQYAQATGSVSRQIAAYQGAMNKMQPTTLSQGFLNSLADYAKGLPALYSERRRTYIDKLDGFLAEVKQAQAEAQFEQAQWQAEFDEKARHNRVSESISATNASTNAAFQATRLGLSAQDQAFDQQQDLTAQATPAPYGYNRDPATGKPVRDPRIPTASSAGSGGSAAPSAARGQYVPNKLRKEGYVGGWKVKPKGVKGPFVQATDGTYWRKPAGASSGSTPKPKAGTPSFDVQKDLTYSLDNGFIDGTDAGKSIPQLVRFLRKHQPSTGGSAFNKWWAETGAVLKDQDPNLYIWMRDYITRRQRDKSWKGRF